MAAIAIGSVEVGTLLGLLSLVSVMVGRQAQAIVAALRAGGTNEVYRSPRPLAA